MKQKIVYYVLFIFLFVLTSYSTTTFSKYTQDINKQLTLNVSQPNYTISFNKNSTTATGSKESVSCVYGTNCVLGQNTFTNNGYTFAGWNTKADGSGTTYTTSALNLTAINGNTVTLFAIWSADAYSISYDLKGGSESSNPTTYNIETPTFSLNNPTRSGYVFAGWTGSNGSTPQNTVTITKGSTGNKSYTANWNKNASSLTITLSQNTYTYDKTAKTPTVTVKDGSTTLVEGVDYDVTYSNNINAGTANVTITMKNTENATHDATYVGSTTKNFTINKKTVTVTAENKTMNYGDSAPTYTSTISGVISGDTAYTGSVSYTVKNSGGTTLIVNQILPQGTYTIIPSGLTAAANYTITYVNGTLTVNKATPTINLTAKTGMTYNGLAKSSNAATVTLKNGESYSGTITYTYYSNSTCTTQVTTSNSGAASAGGMPVYAGNWYVKATTSAFGNYNAGESSCVAHTIEKATPVISVSGVITYTTPFDTSFTERASVPGKFTNVSSNTNIATVSPSTSPNEIPANTDTTVNVHRVGGGTATFTVTFTPTDTTNYNSITQSSSGKQTFDITFRNKLVININKDNSLWTNVNSFYVKVGNSGGVGADSGVTGTYEFANMPIGSGILYASYLGFDELVNTGQTINNVETSGAYPDITTTLNYYTLTVNAGTCSKATGSGIYLSNQTQAISATPAQGYHFTSWTVSSGGNAPVSTTSETTTVSTSKTTTLTANCVKNPNYTLTLLYNHTQDKDFEYTGDYDHYVIPETMIYKFEAWGAQGGSSVYNGSISTTYVGGKGAYTSGYLPLTKDSKVYVYVGQHPSSASGGKTNNPGGWNGGGLGRWDKNDDESGGGGGGATDFRIYNSILIDFDELAWNNAKNLRNRIMVAAGGAGNNYTGGGTIAAGGLASFENSRPPATQTTGYAFGIGQDGRDTKSRTGNGGGGGGYWGGYGGWQNGTGTDGWTSTTGGSSYISGYTGAVAVASSEVNTPRYASDGVTLCSDGTTDNVCSHHFSGNIFTDDPYTGDPMKIIDGNSEMPAHDQDEDVTTTIGNAGHGYARISVYSYQKEVTNGDEVGYIPAPMLEEGEPLIVDGEPVLDEDGEPIVIGAQEINWLDENDNPVYEHSIYDLNRDTTWHADGYRPKEYKITYNLNGGTANNPTHYNEETETFTLERPTREGYRFDGWTGSNGDIPQKDVTIEEGSAGSKEYVANWTAGSTLTINTNGGVYTGENPRVEPSGTSISIPAPKLVGRRFTGWTIKNSYGGNAHGTITNNEPLTSPQTYIYGDGNDTITANWVDRDDITITFNAMGGTPVTSQVGSYGDMWARYVTTTREGYIFDGWYDKEIGGNRVCSKSCGGTFTDDETWYAHWIGGTAKVEYDYNINQTFGTASMLDTYVRPDWTKDYDFDIKFTPGTSGKRYLLLGNYDASSANALNIEITTANQIRVYVGTGSINASFGTVAIGQENILHLHWNASTKQMTGELSGAGSGTYTGTLNGLTGVAGRNLRTGTLDYRQGTTNVFTSINISGLVISQYYESPLAEEITVPDPASYYLLFDGWTGANGDTPEYNLTVPLNSYGTITYIANWSPGAAPKNYKSGNYSTSNSYIKFYYNVGVRYVDQARRKAYTYERVYFYRTNTGYTTYGTGSMTIKYNGTAYTKSLTESQKITNSGVTLWSRYYNDRSNTFDTVSYPDSGKKSVVIGISKFSHQRFSISGLPKNYTVTLPTIKAIE